MIEPVRPIPQVPADVESHDAREIMRMALNTLGESQVAVAVSFSAEDMVILGLLEEMGARPRVFTVDTGRLPAETLDVMNKARQRFGIDIEVFEPNPATVEEMVAERGLDLFYRSLDDRRRCCDARRVEPLHRALAGSGGWITGLRRDQTRNRAATPKVFVDSAHRGIWKVVPLADWSTDDVLGYAAEHDLPRNHLYDMGYTSIGCAPCTRPVEPGADPRSGRWWWEVDGDGECGMHVARPGN